MAERTYRKYKVVVQDRVVYCGPFRTASVVYDALNELLFQIRLGHPEVSVSLLLAIDV